MTTMILVLALAANFSLVALLFRHCCFRHAAFRCAVSVATTIIMVVGNEVTSACFPLSLGIAVPRYLLSYRDGVGATQMGGVSVSDGQ